MRLRWQQKGRSQMQFVRRAGLLKVASAGEPDAGWQLRRGVLPAARQVPSLAVSSTAVLHFELWEAIASSMRHLQGSCHINSMDFAGV